MGLGIRLQRLPLTTSAMLAISDAVIIVSVSVFVVRLPAGISDTVVLIIVLMFPFLALWLPGQLITSHF